MIIYCNKQACKIYNESIVLMKDLEMPKNFKTYNSNLERVFIMGLEKQKHNDVKSGLKVRRLLNLAVFFLPLAPTTKPVLGESYDFPMKSLSRPISTGFNLL